MMVPQPSLLVVLFVLILLTRLEAAKQCTSLAPVVSLPTAFGLDKCIGSNLNRLLSALSGSKCSFTALLAVKDDPMLKRLITVVQSIASDLPTTSKALHQFMKTTSAQEMTNLCHHTFPTLLNPCLTRLVPALLQTIQTDSDCCGQLGDLVDSLEAILPPHINTLDNLLLHHLTNGLNRFLCSNKQSEGCGYSMLRYFSTEWGEQEFRLLKSVVLPFQTIRKGQVCRAMQGLEYEDALQPEKKQKTHNYSCCVQEALPLVESFSAVVNHLLQLDLETFLNGIVDRPTDAIGRFASVFDEIQTCRFQDKCTPPTSLIEEIPQQTRRKSAFVHNNDNARDELKGIDCEKEQICDQHKNCATICRRGSVKLNPWYAKTLKFQQELAKKKPFCYSQTLGTHNAVITKADGYGIRDQIFNRRVKATKPHLFMKTNNQMLSMTDQLNIGSRFIEVDTHYFLDKIRIGHCGGMGSASVQVAFDVIKEQLSEYGEILWTPTLLGCFPSVSGLSSEEHLPFVEKLAELKTWLDKEVNQKEFLIIYIDSSGSDLVPHYGTINDLAIEYFGAKVFSKDDQQKLGDWNSFSTGDLTKMGKNIMFMTNADQKQDVLFPWDSVCNGGITTLKTKYALEQPSADHVLGGVKLYNGKLTRVYQADLRYLTINERGEVSKEVNYGLSKEMIAGLTRWNINIINVDSFSPKKAEGIVWSFQDKLLGKDTSNISNKAIYMKKDSRWHFDHVDSNLHKACLDETKLKWKIISVNEKCPSDFVETSPQDPFLNTLLHRELVATPDISGVQINAPETPSVTTETPSITTKAPEDTPTPNRC